MDLETIFQNYFNCKKPFKKNGQLSYNGVKAYGKLIDLTYNFYQIGIIPSAEKLIKEIDNIININY